jgi:arsenate reductase
MSSEEKHRVAFVCVHSAARSEMAETFLNHLAPDRFEAESAGFEPGPFNPLAVEAMKEVDIDISANQSKSVFGLYKAGRLYDYVITVCDESSGERCPIFSGRVSRLHWSFEDPASLRGSHGEKLAKIRKIRNQIKTKVEELIAERSGGGNR